MTAFAIQVRCRIIRNRFARVVVCHQTAFDQLCHHIALGMWKCWVEGRRCRGWADCGLRQDVRRRGGLQIGAGGTSGSISGDVALGLATTLSLNRVDSVSLAGAITGTGALLKQGAGTLQLTGANSYSGGTTVADGSVIVGDGGTSGAIAAAGDLSLTGGTVLAFDRSDDIAFTGAVAGAGDLEQRGSGTLTL